MNSELMMIRIEAICVSGKWYKIKIRRATIFLYLEPNPMEQITTSNTNTLLVIQDNILPFVNTKGSFPYSKR